MSLMARIRALEALAGNPGGSPGVATANKAIVVDGNKTIDRLNIAAGNFTGTLTGNSTGVHTGNVTGNVTGAVTGNVTGNITLPVATPAAAGTVLGNATALSYGINAVTGADDTKGVSLPAGIPGKQLRVINTVANKILKVWPTDGNTAINAIAAGGNLSMGNGTACIVECITATQWRTIPTTPS